jgi:hypothetical protein
MVNTYRTSAWIYKTGLNFSSSCSLVKDLLGRPEK